MKKILFSALALSTLGLVAFTNLAELPIGAEMPKADYKMKDISGKEITLKEAKKKNGLLVMFSCNTCPYVIKNQQRTNEISAYALKNDIGVVQQYAKSQGYRWYYTVDQNSTLADAFGANRTPETFLFNKEGKLVYHGAIDDKPGEKVGDRAHLKEAINEMVAGKDVSLKTSRSVGCSIKRIK
jgi:thioredoxin-related protein